jgi:uncharacterized protein YggE
MATVTVIGRAEVSCPPDEASLTIVVDAVRQLPAEALGDAAERSRELVALLDELGIGRPARQTTGVSVSEEGEHRDGTWQRRGYRASERFTVRSGDVATIGRLLADAVDRIGARVEGPWWSVSVANPARADALARAAADARARAEALVAELGGTIGAMVEAVETGAVRPEPRLGAMRQVSFDAVPVEAGETTIAASVAVTFQVEA